MKHSIIFTTVIALALTAQIVSAGSIANPYTTGETLTATKMNDIRTAVNDNDSRIASKVNSGIDFNSFTANKTVTSTASTLLSQSITAPASSGGGFVVASFTWTADVSRTDTTCSSYIITVITESATDGAGSGVPSFTYNWYPNGAAASIYIFTVASSQVFTINAGQTKTLYVRARTDSGACTSSRKSWSGNLRLTFAPNPKL